MTACDRMRQIAPPSDEIGVRLEVPVGRRQAGSGSIQWQAARGRWRVRVTLRDGSRPERFSTSRDVAEQKLRQLLAEHADQLGYFYQHPAPYFFGTRPAPARQGVTPKVRWFILERDHHRCRYCGATPEDAALAVDHVVPVAHGGTDDTANLVTACELCNQGKADSELVGPDRGPDPTGQ